MKLLREPLLHFLLLGAALFAGYRLVNREPQAGAQQIVVSAGQLEHMVATFAGTWQRAPDDEELKGLIGQYVREEVLSREAIKLGLDKNDALIRQRLQQKMEFIADDLAAAEEPGEKDLADYLANHPDAFRQDRRISFRQVYLSAAAHGDQLDADAARLLAELKSKGAQADISALGDGSSQPSAFTNEPQRGVERSFGKEFTAEVFRLPTGEWSGPLKSGLGAHLVVVEARSDGRVPALAEVREAVEREWANDRRQTANRKFLDDLLKKYQVTIQWPKPEKKTTAPNR